MDSPEEPTATVVDFPTQTTTTVEPEVSVDLPKDGPPKKDQIVEDIRAKTGAKFVVDNVAKDIQDAKKILHRFQNQKHKNPEIFKHDVIRTLIELSGAMEVVINGFRILEHEGADILVRLHHAYVSFIAENEGQIRNDLGARFDQQGLGLQRLNSLNGVRQAEILRIEHSVRVLQYNLAERGMFNFPVDPGTAEANVLLGNKQYREDSARILEDVMGVESKRGPFGEVKLKTGVDVHLYNIGLSEMPEDY